MPCVCGPGYGNAPPLTVGGRAFCVLYGLFGLPLFIIAAYGIGDQLFHGIDKLRLRVYDRLLHRKAPPRKSVTRTSYTVLLYIVLFIGVINVFYVFLKFRSHFFYVFKRFF